MNTNRQTFFDQSTALTAPLAGVGGVHREQLTASLFHFVCQHLGEHAQACIVRGQGKVSVAVHEFEVQVFDNDQGVRFSQITGKFMPVITALLSDLLVQTGNLPDRFVPSLTPLLSPGDLALGDPQFG